LAAAASGNSICLFVDLLYTYTSDIYSFGVGLLSHNLQVVMAK
jgi:hypothetical protein